MRKILLATTALVAFAGAAQAAEAPIQVTLGGFVDFRAAMFHEAEKTNALDEARRGGDFQTEYGIEIGADGKAAGGIEYGAKISLGNDTDDSAVPGDNIELDQAYIYMSGAWGKILMGDEQGATDLFVYAPTVGEGQIDGSYTDFTDAATLAQFQPTYIDMGENNTKVTYYTPKVGNAKHKVQMGVSYIPNEDNGISVVKYNRAAYRNEVEAAVQYTGSIQNVNVALTPMIAMGDGQGNKTAEAVRDYTVWGVGGQASYAGFTMGASYVDAGHKNTTVAQRDDQNVATVGLMYEFDKVAMAVNYMNGEGYYNGLTEGAHVDSFSAVGLGATYTWFPGLTTAADAVLFDQSIEGVAHDNEGTVLMLSQKMTF